MLQILHTALLESRVPLTILCHQFNRQSTLHFIHRKINELPVTSKKYAHLDKSNKQLGLLPRDLWSGLERGR